MHMGNMDSANACIEDAAQFLEPVLRPSKRPTIEITLVGLLLPRCKSSPSPGLSDRTAIAIEAIHYLLAIVGGLDQKGKMSSSLTSSTVPSVVPTATDIDDILQTPLKRRVITTLLDVAVIEGIYPYLDIGVGLPLETRMYSTFKNWEMSVEHSARLMSWDFGATEILYSLNTLRENEAMTRLIDDRILIDFLPFVFQAAYKPTLQNADALAMVPTLIDKIQNTRLQPTVASLLRPQTPKWLTSPLSAILARAPMRKHGVQDTINFVATAEMTKKTSNSETTPSSGPTITISTLERVAQILRIAPQGVEHDIWFKSIGLQLLKMLSDQSSDEQKAASLIMGIILSTRKTGAPGTAGWRWLVLPILGTISPSENLGLAEIWSEIEPKIEPMPTLHWGVLCLSRLLLLHPNLGLIKRLGNRVYIHLWALACVTKSRPQVDQVFQNAISIIREYVSVEGPDAVIRIIKRFFFKGSNSSEYAVTEVADSRVVCMNTLSDSEDALIGGMQLIRELESRSVILCDILDGLGFDDLCNVFIALLDIWAKGQELCIRQEDDTGLSPESDFQLILVKVVQTMLGRYRPVYAANPSKMIPLVCTLLKQFIQAQTAKQVDSPNLNIVQQDQENTTNVDSDSTSALASFGLGLLGAIFDDDWNVETSQNQTAMYDELKTLLRELLTLPNLAYEIQNPAEALSTQLSLSLKGKASTKRTGQIDSLTPGEDDSSKFRELLVQLRSPLAPIRAEGLTALNKLIEKLSPVVSTPTTLALLMALIGEKDEYTYLSAINSMSLFATLQPDKTLPQLTDTYVDADESSSLEIRLRIGESIQQVIKNMTPRASYSSATKVLEGMIAVSGRRAVKIKEPERRAQILRQEERERRRVEREWGGEVPELPEDFREEVTPADEAAARIMEQWAGSGIEEDFRLRASAMSIIQSLLIYSIERLSEALVADAVQVALLIIQYETDEGAAILRRAAVLIFEGLVMGANKARGNGQALQWASMRDSLDKIVSSLEMVKNNDVDRITRGHATEVLKMVATSEAELLQVKWQGEHIRFDLGDQLRGLSVQPDIAQPARPKIQEID